VSKGAAQKLRFIRAGLIRVRIRVLSLPDEDRNY
jgi:rare lipoprotein A (peptidoglycan hydrolase)